MSEELEATRQLRFTGLYVQNNQAGSAYENGQEDCAICLESMDAFKNICVYSCSHWSCTICTRNSATEDGGFPCPFKCRPENILFDAPPRPVIARVTPEIIQRWKPKIPNKTEEEVRELKAKVKALEKKLEGFSAFDYVTWVDFHRMVEDEVSRAMSKKRSREEEFPDVSTVKKEKNDLI